MTWTDQLNLWKERFADSRTVDNSAALVEHFELDEITKENISEITAYLRDTRSFLEHEIEYSTTWTPAIYHENIATDRRKELVATEIMLSDLEKFK